VRRAVVAGVLTLGALMPAAATGDPPPCCQVFGQPSQMTVSHDGRFVYVSDHDATLTLEHNPQTGALGVIDVDEGGGSLQDLSSDGRFLYVASAGSVVWFARDPKSGELTYRGQTSFAGSGYPGDFALSSDGEQAYHTDLYALRVFDRNPQTGKLTQRATLKDGVNGLQMYRPTSLAASPDNRFVYVADAGETDDEAGIVLLARSDAGALSFAGRTTTRASKLRLSPNGGKLFAGSEIFARDQLSGALSNPTSTNLAYVSAESQDVGVDAAFAFTPDWSAAYGVDFYSDSLTQTAGPAFATTKTYRDGDYGIQGLYKPVSVAVSPDGKLVYVAGGVQFRWGNSPRDHGTVAVLRRDPATSDLSFVALFRGQYFDGRPLNAPPPSVVINGGDAYTNDRNVTVTIDLPREGEKVELSNDGGFADSARFPWEYRLQIPWTLASTGPDRLPKAVYARIAETWGAGPAKVYTDDIVLDETAPKVTSARVRSKLLTVKARDARSGVARIQITSDRKHPGRWRRYSKKREWSVGGGTVYVRVRDRARNASHWRKAER
jgi:DNA-binding beta-propeller fold protein YncE